ncbi:MAG: hypothetical protein H6997_00865 [Moraxellaceae bacterium]|nr:hypothetical protein [Pseudomonadales bacterium]MCP5176094.1 hypothetical protein [Moraxellaceae bacterium]
MKLPTLKSLCVAIALANTQAAYALEVLDDDVMSEATGEGVAFLPENFYMVMRGADNTLDVGTGMVLDNDVTTNRLKDTGYIRYIPVGPLTFDSQDTNKDGFINGSDLPVGKADIFLYGMAVSQSSKAYGAARVNTDWNGRFGRAIDTWGTSANPWLFKTVTQNGVPDFNAPAPTSTSSGNVTYFGLEAPLYNTNVSALSAAEKSAYNLKFAYWLDAFVRDPNVAENLTATGTQFNVGGAGRANRLRMQAIWDGVSLNGSEIRMFQTLGGAATGVNGMSNFYNNTLGLTGVLRFNSGDGETLRASVTTSSSSRNATAFVQDGAYGCGTTSVAFSTAACQFRFQSRTVTDSVSGLTWTPPSLPSVLRLSTKETSNTALLDTPAINGGSAPTFDSAEGLNFYNVNMNVVLGQLYQPLVVGVASDNKNLVLEVARIANKESVYKQIYTNYDNSNPITNGGYTGSTCNFYQCGAHPSGTPSVISSNYQAKTATHSSISIGSTVYNAANNTLEAYSGAESFGVSFGELQTRVQAGPFTTVRTEIEFQQRQLRTRTGVFTDTYLLEDPNLTPFTDTADPFGHPSGDCSGGNTCRRYYNRIGVHNDWEYLTAFNAGTGVKTYANTDGSSTTLALFGTPMPGGVNASGTTNTPGAPFVRGAHDCPGGTGTANQCNGEVGAGGARGAYGVGEVTLATPNNNRDWDLAGRNLTWFPVVGQAAFVYGQTTDIIPLSHTVDVNASPLNNMGSAVIDGLLIQHLKITTKGL